MIELISDLVLSAGNMQVEKSSGAYPQDLPV